MPRQNRVTPFGAIIATPARGRLMGNRGCLHDAAGQIRRPFQLKRWIICVLEFKGRRRAVMTPGQYTELFFLDEATALAAGHRPCAECQRERFNVFRAIWAKANPALAGSPRPAAPRLDEALHRERLTPAGRQQTHPARLNELPDGTFVALAEAAGAALVWQGQLWPWSPFGYNGPALPLSSATVTVLTPPSIVRTLAAGYRPGVHPSATPGSGAAPG